MSVEAITWALAQKVERSSTKFVLVVLANCAGHDGTCWPSVAYLAESTSQDRKTVLENLRRLKEQGLLEETGLMRGRTGGVPVYRVLMGGGEADSKTEPVPKKGPVPKTDASGPDIPGKQSRFSAEAVPKTGHGTNKEPSENLKGTKDKAPAAPSLDLADLMADGVREDVAAEFLAHRKRKRAPLTRRAWDGIKREVEAAAWSLDAALIKAMERNWIAFEAAWVEPRNLARPAGRTGAHSGFEGRDYSKGVNDDGSLS